MLKKKFIVFLLLLILLSLGIVKLIDNYYSETTRNYIYNESQIVVYNTLNSIVSEAISPYLNEELLYVNTVNNLVSNVIINTNQNNKILKAVHNKLNTLFNTNLNNSFKSLKIPIGSLISKNIFAGKGFIIDIPIKPIGSYSVDLKTKSKAQGINTSLLEVILNISFSIQTIIPLNINTNTVSCEFILSSVLVQGEVPNYYYASNSNESFPYIPNN
ncbi:MAG: sporulation protein YunB [Bacilli bacterium]|nr:sporulation protein YunB [Bacilli bacterium]